MKTFKEYLLEDSSSHEDWMRQLTDGLEIINGRCSNFLREFGTDPIYRGVGRNSKIFAEFPVRNNRSARDTHLLTNFVFNIAMESLFKIPMVRREALFATGSASQSSEYGRPAFIFLPDGYKGIFSEKIRDIAHEEGHIERALWQEITTIIGNREDLDEFLEHGDFTISKMKRAFGTKSKEILDKITEYFKPRYQNKISEKSKFNEMSFYGLTEYYAVDVEMFGELFDLNNKHKHLYKGDLDRPEYYYAELIKMIKEAQ